MDRLNGLDFDADFGYEESAAGILVPIRLIHDCMQAGVELSAPLATGALGIVFSIASTRTNMRMANR